MFPALVLNHEASCNTSSLGPNSQGSEPLAATPAVKIPRPWPPVHGSLDAGGLHLPLPTVVCCHCLPGLQKPTKGLNKWSNSSLPTHDFYLGRVEGLQPICDTFGASALWDINTHSFLKAEICSLIIYYLGFLNITSDNMSVSSGFNQKNGVYPPT
jgi:hypothetical protein